MAPWAKEPSKLYFAARDTLPGEMAHMGKLRREDPAQAKVIMDLGESFVDLAKAGNLRALINLLESESVPPEHMLQWFVIRMFRECCKANQVHVAKFMLDHGLDASSPPLRETLHEVVRGAKYDDKTWVAMVKILTEAGFSPNCQVPPGYKTPLHEAAEKELITLAETLIDAGADVNAVAEDDVMPLNCADRAAATVTHKLTIKGREEDGMAAGKVTPMQALLQSRGAKRTWRKAEPPAEAQRRKRLEDFLASEREVGEGKRTFSAGC